MSIQAVGAGVNNYNAPKMKKVNFGETPAVQTPQAAPEAKANKGGWGKAIASFFITGLGQMCDGRTKDGLKQLGTVIGLGVVSGATSMLAMGAKNKYVQIAGLVGSSLAGIASLGTWIYSIVDAYKGGKN